MASAPDPKAVDEIVGTIINQRKRLKRDVVEMCNLVLRLREKFDGKLGNYRQSFDDGCSVIYRSLKLHLAFHCGNDGVSGHKKLAELGCSLKLQESDIVPGEEHAVDPVSKVLEIVTFVVSAPEAESEAANKPSKIELVFKIVQGLLGALGSKNTFRPHVLAKVWWHDKGFLGSSMAVSSFLRPLCLHERVTKFHPRLRKAIVFAKPLQSPPHDQASSWSSIAYKGRYVQEPDSDEMTVCYDIVKAPCKNCQEMFKNLSGFIGGELEAPESARGETFLGGCAEYCPVNALIPNDDVERDSDSKMYSKLERHREQCSSLFEDMWELCELANKHDVKRKGDEKKKGDDKKKGDVKKKEGDDQKKGDDKKEDNDKKLQILKNAAKEKVDKLNIFGFRPNVKCGQ